jgi:hypothetical protein
VAAEIADRRRVVIRTIEANKTEATIVVAAEIADRRLGYDFSTYVLTNKVCRMDD